MKALILIASIFFVTVSCKANSPQTNTQNQTQVPQEVLVKFKEGFSKEKQESLIQSCQGKVIDHLQGINVYLVRVTTSTGEAISCFRRMPELKYVEPNRIVHVYPKKSPASR